jgi:hypothetical protein
MLQSLFHFVWLALLFHSVVAAESASVYRCGNAYTNQPNPSLNCQPLKGGNVTVIEGTRLQAVGTGAAATSASTVSSATTKVDPSDQRLRDAQAQVVLQTELQKAQQQQAALHREWNNGEPERRADEFRQPQKYQERVAQLRAAVQRTDADVAGLQRELARLSSSSSGTKP